MRRRRLRRRLQIQQHFLRTLHPSIRHARQLRHVNAIAAVSAASNNFVQKHHAAAFV